MNESEQRLLDILDYWHKVEFFIPFDLKQVLDTPDAWTVKWIRAADLLAPASTAMWQVRVPEDWVLSGFKLFLGVFKTSAIDRKVRRAAETDPQSLACGTFSKLICECGSRLRMVDQFVTFKFL